jgi:L-lactate dehydrogenase
MNLQKCAIIGCGSVGATIAYTLLGSDLFNEIVLIDVNHKKAEGEAMDIGHGVPFIHPVDIYAGNYEDISDAYLVIVTAGANQMPGESRIDLTSKNIRIFQSVIPEIVRYNSECMLLIVANPVDILTTTALRLSGFPKERVIGTGTVLDSSRFQYQLGEYMGIDHRDIQAFIIGEHGDSEVAVWSSASVSGVGIRDFCDELGIVFTRDQMDDIVRNVKNSAYNIIERKGATFYAVALAVQRIAQALVRDEHSLLPVSGYCDSYYEIDDVCIGLPMIIGRSGIENIVEIPLNQMESYSLLESADALKKVLTDMGIN